MMKLAELTNRDFIAANDYAAGAVFPLLKIAKVEKKKAPNGKGERCVIYFVGAEKPWMCSSNVTLCQLGAAFGVAKVEEEWVGNSISLMVVPGVRRPDGTVGNAFRINKLEKKAVVK